MRAKRKRIYWARTRGGPMPGSLTGYEMCSTTSVAAAVEAIRPLVPLSVRFEWGVTMSRGRGDDYRTPTKWRPYNGVAA